jgi:hypothetical protein
MRSNSLLFPSKLNRRENQLHYDERNKALERPYSLKELFSLCLYLTRNLIKQKGSEISREFILFSHSIWTDSTDGETTFFFTKRKKTENQWKIVHRVLVGKLKFVREITLCQKGSGCKNGQVETQRAHNSFMTNSVPEIFLDKPKTTGCSAISAPLDAVRRHTYPIQILPIFSEDEFQQCISTLSNRCKLSFVSWSFSRVSHTLPVPPHRIASEQTLQ